MRVVASTETFADVLVRMQVTLMSSSVHVWASVDNSAPSLALATPGRLAASSVLLGGVGEGGAASAALASRISRKTGLAVYACLNLPPDAEMLQDAVAKRLLRVIVEDQNAGAEAAVAEEEPVPGEGATGVEF